MQTILDPALYGGGIPERISKLADQGAYFAAFDQDPVAGAFSHEIANNVWVGAQPAAGILSSFEDTPALRASVLEQLRARNIKVIICCCAEGPATRVFADDGVGYADALLSDGSPADIAACVPAFLALVERAFPLVLAAHARGESVLVHCNSGMHRSASVAIALLMALRGERGAEGLARVFSEVVHKRPVMRPTFWPLLESEHFAQLCEKLRA
jgi:hypothetical protein